MNKMFPYVFLRIDLLRASFFRYRGGFRRYFCWFGLLFPIFLIGCEQYRDNYSFFSEESNRPDTTILVDYHDVTCHLLWMNEESEAMMNPLYWLRIMHCAEDLSDAQAWQQTQSLSGHSWYTTVKQTLLMGRMTLTAIERQQLLMKIDYYHTLYPPSLFSLLQLWREKQQLLIALEEEKTHYQQLQSSSEAQLKAWRETQSQMQEQLNETMRKLENLTDIERQLSSRKQISREMPENAVKEGVPGEDQAPDNVQPHLSTDNH